MKIALLFTTLLLMASCSKKVTTVGYSEQKPKSDIAMVIGNSNELELPKIDNEPVQRHGTITVYFDLDSYILNNSEKSKLKQVEGKVSIVGGCCPLGTDQYNKMLGLRRAHAVAAVLQKNKVKISNIVSVGEDNLISTDPKQYHLNRRCEVKY